jgi:sugar/nucleoside kinase (ribokinase family)
VIVVIGSPTGRSDDGVVVAAGMASRVALAAAAAGRTVQLVGKTGDDPTADGVVLDLTRGGVGHVALLRDPAHATPLEMTPADDEPADLEATDDGAVVHGDAAAGRTLGPALESADVDLGLRYLTDFAVVVLAEPVGSDTVAIVAEAARWAGARMIIVVPAGAQIPDGLPSDVVAFEAPDADPDGVFAALVGRFAADLDGGVESGEAFRTSVATDGWTGATDD